MKKIETMIQCLKSILKKKFFNGQKSDISHDCENVFNFDLNNGDENSDQEAEEYLNNYKTTTRWQTI